VSRPAVRVESSSRVVLTNGADACNVFGDASTVRHKVEVLHKHCATVDRNPADITVTQLSVPGDVVHILAMGVWLGGLVMLCGGIICWWPGRRKRKTVLNVENETVMGAGPLEEVAVEEAAL